MPPKVVRIHQSPPEPKSAHGNLFAEVDAIFVAHTAFTQLRDRIVKLMPLHGTAKGVPCIPFVGPSGVGKSTIYDKLGEAFPVVKDGRRVELDTGEILVADHVPLLRIRMPTRFNENTVLKLLLAALGAQKPSSGDQSDKLERLGLYLAACGTRLVVVDEAQRLVERTGEITAHKVVDIIKDVHELAHVSFVMLGLERIRVLYEVDGQIDRRWSKERKILPYLWGALDAAEKDIPQSRDDFMGLLASFREHCPVPFAQEIDVLDESIAFRFYYVSRGVVGYIKKLLRAAMQVVEPGGEVDFALLSAAFREEFRTDIKGREMVDPFVADWIPRMPPELVDDEVPGRKHWSNKRGRQASAANGPARVGRAPKRTGKELNTAIRHAFSQA